MSTLELQIREHPFQAIAFSALAGVWFATHGKRKREPRGLIVGLVGALTLQLVREAAMAQMGKLARTWIATSTPPTVPTPYAS